MTRVHIPRTATRRGSLDWAKVLSRVRPHVRGGFGTGFDFEGKFLRCGATLDESEVFLPELDSHFAILLECAGPDRANPDLSGACKRYPTLYVLWRYDRASSTWRELARSSAFDASWTADLGPIAIRELRGNQPAPVLDAVACRDRICWLLESELELLEGPVLALVLNAVHDQLAARVAAAQSMR